MKIPKLYFKTDSWCFDKTAFIEHVLETVSQRDRFHSHLIER